MNSINKIFCFALMTVLLGFESTANAQDLEVPILKAKQLFTISSNFRQPSDVVVGRNGRAYVMDGVNNRVKVFSYNGDYLFSFGGAGKADGQFNFPLGIGLDQEGRVYVADSGNHRVQIFSPDGKYLSQFTTETDQGINPSDPTDVAVNSPLKKCYVVDNDNHWILIYDLDQKSISKIQGTMGMEKKEYRFPFFLDIDSQGNLYVVEVINTRVKKIDNEGFYLKNIGGWGVEKGEFYRPKGVAVDPKNRVFVSDSYIGVIQVFDEEGTFLSVLGDEQGHILKFQTPTGLFVDKHGRLYVVEMLANQVQVLHLKG